MPGRDVAVTREHPGAMSGLVRYENCFDEGSSDVFYGRRPAAKYAPPPSLEPMSDEAPGSEVSTTSIQNHELCAFMDASGSLWTKQPSIRRATPWLTARRNRKFDLAIASSVMGHEETIESDAIEGPLASRDGLPGGGSATLHFARVGIPIVVSGEVADLMIRGGSYPIVTVSLFALGIAGLACVHGSCASRSRRRPAGENEGR